MSGLFGQGKIPVSSFKYRTLYRERYVMNELVVREKLHVFLFEECMCFEYV